MLILRNDDLAGLLTPEITRTALLATFHEQADGKVDLPARLTVDSQDGSWLRLMPAIHNASSMMGFKAMNVAPDVGMRAFIGLIDLVNGLLVALLDADSLTTLRTAETAAIATDLFAAADIESMALLGSGTMAAGVLRAIARVRKLARVDVFSPNAEHRRDFARRMSVELGIDVRAVESARAAIRPANLVCGAYRAPNVPAIDVADLRSHVHINSLSSVRPEAREVTAEVWRACSCVVLDHRAGVAQSGDGLSVLRDHPFDLERAPELWEIVRDGNCRSSEDGRTMYKSVGTASQDISLATAAYRLATEAGIGETIAEFPALRPRR
jgi:ornithine cyclodeaminase/alanine dehydrogenase-like protein (mu-crystallin family)